MSYSYRNITLATIAGVSDLLTTGSEVEVRGSRVRELRNRVTVLERPLERCLFLPNRNNDVIASLAETFWVISGRDDIAWLSHYLPRAAEFSDDGSTWRGAYGPRLRDWHGVDQLEECLHLLKADPNSRRAVMSLFDPSQDFCGSKDIPCNNWLNWLLRDGRLHLTVGVRSNDAIWGFSGINSFEWSVLQQMMALWLGVEAGDATYLATSFHVYERHYQRSDLMLKHFRGITCYDFDLTSPTFTIPFERLDATLKEWFALEEQLRGDLNAVLSSPKIQQDPLLSISIELMRLHQGIRQGWSEKKVVAVLESLPASDLTAAAYEWCSRRFPRVVEHCPDPRIGDFLREYTGRLPARSMAFPTLPIVERIKQLHASKNAAYGNAWKKRGELTSILANIARKVDRLEQYKLTQTELPDESLADTAIDLFVYLLKHRLYLREQLGTGHLPLEGSSSTLAPLSDQLEAFDALIERYDPGVRSTGDFSADIDAVLYAFEALHAAALNTASIEDKLQLNESLSEIVWPLVVQFGTENKS